VAIGCVAWWPIGMTRGWSVTRPSVTMLPMVRSPKIARRLQGIYKEGSVYEGVLKGEGGDAWGGPTCLHC